MQPLDGLKHVNHGGIRKEPPFVIMEQGAITYAVQPHR